MFNSVRLNLEDPKNELSIINQSNLLNIDESDDKVEEAKSNKPDDIELDELVKIKKLLMRNGKRNEKRILINLFILIIFDLLI